MHYRSTTIVLVVLGFILPGGTAYVVYVYKQRVATINREQAMPLKQSHDLPLDFGLAHATGMLPPGGSA